MSGHLNQHSHKLGNESGVICEYKMCNIASLWKIIQISKRYKFIVGKYIDGIYYVQC